MDTVVVTDTAHTVLSVTVDTDTDTDTVMATGTESGLETADVATRNFTGTTENGVVVAMVDEDFLLESRHRTSVLV